MNRKDGYQNTEKRIKWIQDKIRMCIESNELHQVRKDNNKVIAGLTALKKIRNRSEIHA
jgi:hypothetical protein